MRFLICNIRGFGAPGRCTQVKDYMRPHRVDVIGLQETIRQDFTMPELWGLERGGQFI
jgi:hypothetical protein